MEMEGAILSLALLASDGEPTIALSALPDQPFAPSNSTIRMYRYEWHYTYLADDSPDQPA